MKRQSIKMPVALALALAVGAGFAEFKAGFMKRHPNKAQVDVEAASEYATSLTQAPEETA